MSEFTLTITLQHKRGFEPPLAMAIDLNEAVRIAPRAIEEMRMGLAGFDGAIRLMKVREFRKRLFIETATRLGALLAERMEDAEGWHDANRIEPAREQLGGDWPHL